MKTPFLEDDQAWEIWYEGTDREIRGKALSDNGGESKVGFGLLELLAGNNTGPAHYHLLEEEHLFVLSGTSTLYLGNEIFDLKPGSYVCFPAGQENLHHLVNSSNSPFRYIMVGERNVKDKVVYETDV